MEFTPRLHIHYNYTFGHSYNVWLSSREDLLTMGPSDVTYKYLGATLMLIKYPEIWSGGLLRDWRSLDDAPLAMDTVRLFSVIFRKSGLVTTSGKGFYLVG